MNMFIPVGRIWNPDAIDYSLGVDITDVLTGMVYTQEQAEKLDREIQHRLVNRGRKIGCWVVKDWKWATLTPE